MIAVTDGLNAMDQALGVAFPNTMSADLHASDLFCRRLDYAKWKDRKALAAALRPIYAALTADAAEDGAVCV